MSTTLDILVQADLGIASFVVKLYNDYLYPNNLKPFQNDFTDLRTRAVDVCQAPYSSYVYAHLLMYGFTDESGKRVEADPVSSLNIFEKIIALPKPIDYAHCGIGIIYEDGLGVDVDVERAMSEYSNVYQTVPPAAVRLHRLYRIRQNEPGMADCVQACISFIVDGSRIKFGFEMAIYAVPILHYISTDRHDMAARIVETWFELDPENYDTYLLFSIFTERLCTEKKIIYWIEPKIMLGCIRCYKNTVHQMSNAEHRFVTGFAMNSVTQWMRSNHDVFRSVTLTDEDLRIAQEIYDLVDNRIKKITPPQYYGRMKYISPDVKRRYDANLVQYDGRFSYLPISIRKTSSKC